MEMTRQERIELHDRLVVMLDGVRKELMSRFPEIISVDLGLKERGGKLTSEFSWRVFVKEKKAASELKPEQMIPKEVAGIPTDVFLHENSRVLLDNVSSDSSSYEPLLSGIQITGSGLVGTLGFFATLTGQTAVHMVSCHHVLLGPSGSNGDLVGQPNAACDLCCCKCCEVAKIVTGVVGTAGGANNTVDAAMAILIGQTAGDSKTIRFTNSIVGLGPIFGSGTAAVGDVVRKRGRTTLLSTGTVTSITSNPTVNQSPDGTGVNVAYTGQISITPTDSTAMALGGDSGAGLINATNQIVGLVFAGTATTGFANKIADVSTQLGGLTVLSSGTAATVPHVGYAIEAPIVTANPANFLSKIESKLKETPCGQEFLNAIHENRREVLDLINDHREVKVAWNRFQGPAYIGHFAKNANEPDHRIPNDINGYSLQNLLIKMNDVLERNGSRKLAKAVEDYSQAAFQFAHEYAGMDSLDAMLHRGDYCPKCGMLKNGKHYA
jgi:hypothetical protein